MNIGQQNQLFSLFSNYLRCTDLKLLYNMYKVAVTILDRCASAVLQNILAVYVANDVAEERNLDVF